MTIRDAAAQLTLPGLETAADSQPTATIAICPNCHGRRWLLVTLRPDNPLLELWTRNAVERGLDIQSGAWTELRHVATCPAQTCPPPTRSTTASTTPG